MANPLIAALRARTDLKESVLHTAQEIAARASFYGVARVSYTYLKPKCHCCKQTVINHVKVLIEKGIIERIRQRVVGKLVHEINVYKFKLPYQRQSPSDRTKRGSQNFCPKFPMQEKGEEKEGRKEEGGKHHSIREQIAGMQRGLQRMQCSPDSIAYQSTMEKIAALTALLPEGGGATGERAC
jgi:hypothetical protein